jgi:hypothetical protein
MVLGSKQNKINGKICRKQSKVLKTAKLKGVPNSTVLCGNARKKHWRMSRVKSVIIALPNKYFLDLGLFLPGS